MSRGNTQVIIYPPPPLDPGFLGHTPISKGAGERLITVILDHLVIIHTPIRGWTPSFISLHLVGRAPPTPALWHRDAGTSSSCDP